MVTLAQGWSSRDARPRTPPTFELSGDRPLLKFAFTLAKTGAEVRPSIRESAAAPARLGKPPAFRAQSLACGERARGDGRLT